MASSFTLWQAVGTLYQLAFRALAMASLREPGPPGAPGEKGQDGAPGATAATAEAGMNAGNMSLAKHTGAMMWCGAICRRSSLGVMSPGRARRAIRTGA
jgi:hypothetical protein